jgi:hypothetical protein
MCVLAFFKLSSLYIMFKNKNTSFSRVHSAGTLQVMVNNDDCVIFQHSVTTIQNLNVTKLFLSLCRKDVKTTKKSPI